MSVKVEILKDNKIEDIIYFVKNGDSLDSIAQKFCVKVETLLEDNDLSVNDKVEEGQIIWIRRRNTAIHIVKPLETLGSISKKYGVSVEHIQKLNNITTVFIGQKILI